jgi:DNA-binding Lrp family transcriptional regulator
MTRVHCTAPASPSKSKVPFAAIPHEIAGDPRLTPTDKALLLALTFWARSKDHCWPSDASIGLRIGRSEATVQRRLKQLETLGLIRRQRASNRTGRLIYLTWREGQAAALVRPPAPAPVRDEGNVVVKGDASKAFAPHHERPRCAPSPSLSAGAPEPAPCRPRLSAPAVVLTADQQARLEEMPPSSRERILTWLALDDPIARLPLWPSYWSACPKTRPIRPWPRRPWPSSGATRRAGRAFSRSAGAPGAGKCPSTCCWRATARQAAPRRKTPGPS